MSAVPNAPAAVNFEFEALRHAANYRRALLAEFRRELRGQVIEVGAGIGQVTELVAALPGVQSVLAVEPDAGFNAEFRRRLPGFSLVPGTVSAVPPGTPCDTLVSVNVLEHVREDEPELASYAQLLQPRRGALCLFVPARPEIYAPLDQDFGHFRRYTRSGLQHKLQRAGFEVVQHHYFNLVGYFAWWATFCLLRKRHFNPAAVWCFDRVIFPPVHALESRMVRPPFGQSLLAIARVKS
jgi:SAM-dependent methyltransferase